ncbi:hypothetical protein [Streptomyces sp. NBC_00310]|uniref:hypothetical protein n=1 Tax=Streptomyces sp. NBC_00310 TaxID=2903645 RepID=UPI002E1BDED5
MSRAKRAAGRLGDQLDAHAFHLAARECGPGRRVGEVSNRLHVHQQKQRRQQFRDDPVVTQQPQKVPSDQRTPVSPRGDETGSACPARAWFWVAAQSAAIGLRSGEAALRVLGARLHLVILMYVGR